MRARMHPLITALILVFLLLGPGLFAQEADQPSAIIISISRIVEVMHSGQDYWEPAYEGQILYEDTLISTGFSSQAIIQAGSSRITLRPLTRLTLREIRELDQTEMVNINLQTGRLRVEVDTSPGNNRTFLFEVETPSSVAAVRGTIFEIDTRSIYVEEGTVEFTGSVGSFVLVDAQGFSRVDETMLRAQFPPELIRPRLRPELPIASVPAIPASPPPEALPTLGFSIGVDY